MTDYSKTPDYNERNDRDQALNDELRENQMENERLQAQLEEQQRQEKLREQQQTTTATENNKRFKKRSDKTPAEQTIVNNDKQIHDALDTVDDAKDQVHNAKDDIGKQPTMEVQSKKPQRKARKKRTSGIKKAVAGIAGAVAGKKVIDNATSKDKDDTAVKKQTKREVDPFDDIKQKADIYGNKAVSNKEQYSSLSNYFKELQTLDPSSDKETFTKGFVKAMDKYGVKHNEVDPNSVGETFAKHLATVKRSMTDHKLQYQAYSALSDNLNNLAETKDPRQLNNYGKELSDLYHKSSDFSGKKMDEYNALSEVDPNNVSMDQLVKLTPNYEGANDAKFRIDESKKDAGSYAKTFTTIAQDYNDAVTTIANVVAKTNNGVVQNVNDKSERKKDDVVIKNATEYNVEADQKTKDAMPLDEIGIHVDTIKKGAKVDSKAEQQIKDDKQVDFADKTKEDSAELATGVEKAFDNKEIADLVAKLENENQMLKQELKQVHERMDQLENKPNKQKRKKKFFDKFRENHKQFENMSTKDVLLESGMRLGKGAVKIGAKTAGVVLGAVGTASLYAGYKATDLAKRVTARFNEGAQNATAKAFGVQMQQNQDGLSK